MGFFIPIATATVGSFVGRKAFEKTRKKTFEKFQYDFVRLFMSLAIYFLVSYMVIKYFEFAIGTKNFLGDVAVFFGFVPFRPSNEKHQELLQKFFLTGFGNDKINIVAWDIVKLGALIFVGAEWNQFQSIHKIDPEHQPSIITHAIFGLIMFFIGLITVPKFTKAIPAFQSKESFV